MKLLLRPLNDEIKSMYHDDALDTSNQNRVSRGDAGLDLYIVEQQTLTAGETALIHLQIACESNDNQPFLLMPRSSIAKTPLRLCNSIGLIDGGYRGEIMAAVDNIKGEDYTVEPNQRLFQLVAMNGSPISFEIVNDLSESSRGKGGFGSTGK